MLEILKINDEKKEIINEKLGLIIALFIMILIFGKMNENYISNINFINILVGASLTGLIAVGESYLIIGGLVDLSPGSTVAFTSILSAYLLSKGFNFYFTVIIVLFSGVLIGLFNSFFINKVKLEPFIATLASMSIVRGLAFITSDGKPIFIKDSLFIALGKNRLFGIPLSVVILLIVFIIFIVILNKTVFGRNIYIIGGNKKAARLAGINPQQMVSQLYIIIGFLSALGGILLASRMRSGQPAAGVGLEFDAITAAVLGGVAFSGGVGTLTGVFLGLMILQGFNSGLIMLNVPSFWQYIARGMLLLIALSFDYIRNKQREKKRLEDMKKI
ncbi:MAG: ABC transporter permease [Cetobacterium sp.]|uniref:ABC transporter permease n=1 Tax=Cetobacterium sp. TaxID=2071632 RepID=UPI003F3FFB70